MKLEVDLSNPADVVNALDLLLKIDAAAGRVTEPLAPSIAEAPVPTPAAWPASFEDALANQRASELDTPGAREVMVSPGDAQAGPEVDSAGQPWDAKIHSRTKAKTASGEWRVKRGTSGAERPSDLEGVLEQALKKADALPVPPVPPSAAEIFAPPAVTEQQAPTTFADFMSRVSEACRKEPHFSIQVQAALRACDVPGTTALSTDPTLIAKVWAVLALDNPDL